MTERRVLFVSFHFPPRPGVASARAAKLVRYLPDEGWKVDVVAATPGADEDNDLGRGLRLQRVRRRAPSRFAPGLQGLDWAAAIAGPARRLARDASVVLISGGPFAPFALGPLLGRPYVLDLRDPWGWEPRFGRLDSRLRRRAGLAVERAAESAALDRAAALITVTPEIAEHYGELAPELAGRFDVVRHGWEPQDFERPQPERTEPSEVVYAGTFLEGERTPELVVESVRRVRESGRDLQLRLVGSLPLGLRRYTADGEREGWLHVAGHLPSGEAIDAMRRASVLWAQPGDLPFLITGKIYDYLAARRPVVAAAPADGALARLLADTGGGIVVAPGAEEAAAALERALRGEVLPVREDALENLAAPILGRRLAAILERAAS